MISKATSEGKLVLVGYTLYFTKSLGPTQCEPSNVSDNVQLLSQLIFKSSADSQSCRPKSRLIQLDQTHIVYSTSFFAKLWLSYWLTFHKSQSRSPFPHPPPQSTPPLNTEHWTAAMSDSDCTCATKLSSPSLTKSTDCSRTKTHANYVPVLKCAHPPRYWVFDTANTIAALFYAWIFSSHSPWQTQQRPKQSRSLEFHIFGLFLFQRYLLKSWALTRMCSWSDLQDLRPGLLSCLTTLSTFPGHPNLFSLCAIHQTKTLLQCQQNF